MVNNIVVPTSINTVFSLPMLLEKIVDYGLRNHEDLLDRNTLCSIRLVQKSWLSAVTVILRRNNQPMYNLTLTKENSVSYFVNNRPKLLDVFVAKISQRVQEPFPTFSLKIFEDFFREENYNSFSYMLQQCGEGLVQLEVCVPRCAGTLLGTFSNASLPLLKTLTVRFSLNTLNAWDGISLNYSRIQGSANITSLIQTFLSASESLRELNFPFCPPRNALHPSILYITLPISITSLDLRFRLFGNDMDLKPLTRNLLPNLASLKLLVSDDPFSTEAFYNVMEKFCNTLKILDITGKTYGHRPRLTTFVKFPEMKILEELIVHSACFELVDIHPRLNKCLPMLQKLYLSDHKPEMLHKWTKTSALTSVTDFVLEFQKSNPAVWVTPEIMQDVHRVFPNIQKLHLHVSGTQISGLKYVFTQMTQLTCLKVVVYGCETIVNSDRWDSLMTGVPEEELGNVRALSQMENEAKLTKSHCSIRSMTALQTLCLEAVAGIWEGGLIPLISDLTFQFGLMKMNNLNNLNFRGRFMVSDVTKAEWKKMGRTLCYS